MVQLLKRTTVTTLGLFLFSAGLYLNIQSNIGLAPWTAFSMGIAGISGLSVGDVSVITSMFILVIDVLLKEKIGIGTIIDAVLVGKFIDLFIWLKPVPMLNNFAAGVVVLLIGQVFVSVGSYFYIKTGLGCGPRDSLMVALGKRLPKISIGFARGLIEGAALLVGWLCGAKVGVGTVIAVLSISFILDYTFKLLHFDAKALVHEDVITSFRNASFLLRKRKEAKENVQ